MSPRFAPDQVGIVERPAVTVAMMDHRGDPAALGATIARFVAWRRRVGLPPRLGATYNLLHTAPDAADFRLTLCAAADRAAALEDGMSMGEIPGGRWAVLRQVGAADDMGAAVAFLLRHWLPASGEALRDFPVTVQRVSMFPDVPEGRAVTDILLPLKAIGGA